MKQYWYLHSCALAISLVALALVYSHEFIALIDWWGVTSKYGHSIVVFPLIAYLIYERKLELFSLRPEPELKVSILLALVAAGLVLATFIYVEILSETALVIMIPLVVWLIMGRKIVMELAIPMFLIFTTAPIWELFAPLLTEITTDVCYFFLKVFGVPVYREGGFLTIPEGTFEVADGCGGFRYFIVALTLGLASAYLSFTKTYARIAVIAVAIFLAMAGNWVRVMVVIWAGHVTDMQHPFVEEHVNLGWWVFVGVFFPFFLAINKFSLSMEHGALTSKGDIEESVYPNHGIKLGAAVTLAISIMFIVPAGLDNLRQSEFSESHVSEIVLSGSIAGWNGPYPYKGGWRPNYEGVSGEGIYRYENNGRVFDVYIAYYLNQEQDKELVNYHHTLVNANWKSSKDKKLLLSLGEGESLKANQEKISSSSGDKLIWSWYYVAGVETADRRVAKLLELRKIVVAEKVSAIIAVLSENYNKQEPFDELTRDFIGKLNPQVIEILETL